ncbi:alpha/beta hydrolase [Bifidobacterium subtile]|jgi:fermentation-respiration switch protein FrsA (DUF1100 family)|uniref:alpha/beta hydrolase n=1 Tax=Bifidobacterium subtile TaxID=77635 RepID=UPI002F35479F
MSTQEIRARQRTHQVQRQPATARRLTAYAGAAAILGGAALYMFADHQFRFTLDANSRFSLLALSKDHSSRASRSRRGRRNHAEPLHHDAAEEREAEEWFNDAKHPVTITNEDGLRLHAWSFDPDCASPKPHCYAICCHGFSGGPAEMAKYAHRFAAMGFTVLTPASRCHELSEGRYIGMGWLERRDLLQWVRFIVAQDAQARVLLDGVSMGAATVMMACGEESLPSNVVAAIADCGFASVWDQCMFNARTLYHLPRLMAGALVQSMSLIAAHRAGYGFREASCVNQLGNAHIPMLFIHGSADDFVSPASLDRVFRACASPRKQRLLIPGAGHAMSASTDPAAYWRRVNAFVSPLFDL